MKRIRAILVWIIAWFRRYFLAVAVEESSQPPPLLLLPASLAPLAPTEPAPPLRPVEPIYPHRRAKWAKRKGEKPKAPPKVEAEPKPKRESKPKAPRPELRSEDPEQYGQYYFRDAILDQLDVYFRYLKRMKRNDSDAYNLHRRLGIQIMPQSAVNAFDKWRRDQEEDTLSAWWKTNRPGFGAVSYGIDKISAKEETITTLDVSPEQMERLSSISGETRKERVEAFANYGRIVTMSGGRKIDVDGKQVDTGIVWVPKFLYFTKWEKPPATVQKITGDGDIYSMTIYWDRLDDRSKHFQRHNRGGTPQSYAIFVERNTGKVRALRTLITEKRRIASKKERSGSFTVPYKHWGLSDIAGCYSRTDMPPEEYLCRVFMEAALMYESASLGSMVRISATKGRMSATFGVDIKRMSYFFKDRDVVLNAKGSTARIFHIVRPHVRVNGKAVPMHFRGLREFEWAGHKISITVPGRDHVPLSEFDAGATDMTEKEARKTKALDGAKIAEFVNNKIIKEKLGAWRK